MLVFSVNLQALSQKAQSIVSKLNAMSKDQAISLYEVVDMQIISAARWCLKAAAKVKHLFATMRPVQTASVPSPHCIIASILFSVLTLVCRSKTKKGMPLAAPASALRNFHQWHLEIEYVWRSNCWLVSGVTKTLALLRMGFLHPTWSTSQNGAVGPHILCIDDLECFSSSAVVLLAEQLSSVEHDS